MSMPRPGRPTGSGCGRCDRCIKNKRPATTWISTPCLLIMLPGRRLPRRIDEGPTRPDLVCAPEELSEMLPEGRVMVLKNCDGFAGVVGHPEAIASFLERQMRRPARSR